MRLSTLFLLFAGALCGGSPSTELLYNSNGQNQAFASIGRLRAAYQCVASLIEPDGATDSSPAYALTAGHCVSPEAYGVILDRAVPFNVEFNYFIDTRGRTITVKAPRVVWSTMKGVDLALLELDASLGELRAKGLQGVRLSSASPRQGAPAFWVGAPTDNIPQGRTYMRRGECSARGTTGLIEGLWLWHDEIRVDCQDLYASASGSPLFDKSSGMVAGVIGTTTLLSFRGGPEYDCYRNRPCGITPDGPVVEPDTSYASPVGGLRGCFDSAGRVDLTRASCLIDRGEQLAVDIGRRNAEKPVVDGQPARWNAQLSGAYRYYAWKQEQLGLGDCRDPRGYTAPVLLAAAPVIDAPIGTAEGHYQLCVVAGNTASIDNSWQPYRHASIRRKRLDAQPPVAVPEYGVERRSAGYRIPFYDAAPGLGLAQIKQGPPGSTDCADPAGYRLMHSIPTFVRQSDFPYRVCVMYGDDAGNAAPPLVFDFGPPALQPHVLSNGASIDWTRTVAPGSLFLIDTIEVTSKGNVRVEVTDSAGATHAVPITWIEPEYIQAQMPASVRTGPARLKVSISDGSSISADFAIEASSPGIFTANFAGFGPPMGYFARPDGIARPLAVCSAARGYCTYPPIPLGGEELDVVLYGTGFGRDLKSVSVGTEEVPVVFVGPHASWSGVEEMRIRIPPEFILHGYQRIQFGPAAAWLWIE